MLGRERRIPINIAEDKCDIPFSYYLFVCSKKEENDYFKIPRETFLIGSSFGCDFHLSDKEIPPFAIEVNPVFKEKKLLKLNISVIKGDVHIGNKLVKKGELFCGDVLWVGKTLIRFEKAYPFEIDYRNLVAKKLAMGFFVDKNAILYFLKELFKIAGNYKRPLSIVLFSVDFYRLMKENFGENVSKVINRELKRVLNRSIRTSDFLGKIDENLFLLILPETHEIGALSLAKRIKERINTAVLKDKNGEHAFTVSQGVVSLDCYFYKSYRDFLEDGKKILKRAQTKGMGEIEFCRDINA